MYVGICVYNVCMYNVYMYKKEALPDILWYLNPCLWMNDRLKWGAQAFGSDLLSLAHEITRKRTDTSSVHTSCYPVKVVICNNMSKLW
jgi:hypothetical protein